MRRFLTLIITILTLGIFLTGCQLFSTAVSSPSSRQTIAEHSARASHRHGTDENSDRPYQNAGQDPNQDLDLNQDRNKTKNNASSDLPSQMVYLEESCLRATGRKAHLNGRHSTLSITHVIKSNERPSSNGEANFSCLGAPCIILHEGAAAVRVNGQYMLFLADDTIEYEGIYKKKKDVSKDTLKWLHFYDSLSEAERNAINMIPSELADELPERFTMETEALASLAEDAPSYIAALTEKELNETEDLAQSYYNESSSDCEGVDQIYPLDGDFSLYHNAGIEAEYGPGNLIIYKIITVSDRRSGNSYHTVSIARSSKSGAWKIINTGQQGS